MKRVRWGVIGAGGIADRRTIPGMLKSGNAELVSVMEVDPAFAESLRKKYGAKRAWSDARALVADPEIDAVYIASPVALHASQAMLSADAGKHILVEKPLALTSDEGSKVLDYCDARGVRIAAGFMMRFGTGIQQMKKAFESGAVGDMVSAYSQFTCWYPDIPGSWRQKKALGGGGALTDMGVHVIDLLQYVTGSKVRRVAAFHDTLTFHYEVEDSSSALLQLENGAMCALQTNFNIPDEVAKWRFEIFGTRGRLMGDGVLGQVDGGHVDKMTVEGAKGYDAQQDGGMKAREVRLDAEFGDLYAREIESFCASILENRPLAADARDAVYVQRVVEAAYRSSDEGIAVML